MEETSPIVPLAETIRNMQKQLDELIEFKRGLEKVWDEMQKSPMLSMMGGFKLNG